VTTSQQNQSFYEFGDFRIDTFGRALMREGTVVALTGKVVSGASCPQEQAVALLSKGPYHVHPFAPEWRNWYTHQTQNLARFTPHVGSSPTSGTNNRLQWSDLLSYLERMKRIELSCLAAFLLIATALSTFAQQQPCASPVALPTATESRKNTKPCSVTRLRNTSNATTK
jgi:hypothetical protein